MKKLSVADFVLYIFVVVAVVSLTVMGQWPYAVCVVVASLSVALSFEVFMVACLIATTIMAGYCAVCGYWIPSPIFLGVALFSVYVIIWNRKEEKKQQAVGSTRESR